MSGPSFFAPVDVYSDLHPRPITGTERPRPYCSFISHGLVRPPISSPFSARAPVPEPSSRTYDTPCPPMQSRSLCADSGLNEDVYFPADTKCSISDPPALVTPPPPAYATSSPPKYAPMPLDTETALLLAPPPSFQQSEHTRRCARCIESEDPCSHHRNESRFDWIARILIFLNVVVWSMVIYYTFVGNGDPDWPGWGCAVAPHGIYGGVNPYCGNAGTAVNGAMGA